MQRSALSEAKSSHYTWERSHTTLPAVPSSLLAPSGSNINFFDAGISAGGMVKGKGMVANGSAQTGHASTSRLNLSVRKCQFIDFPTLILMVCRVTFSDSTNLFYTTLQPTTPNDLRQYALHVRLVPPDPALDGALDSTAASIRNLCLLVHEPNTRAASLFPLGGTVDERSRRLDASHGSRHGK